MAAAFRSLSRTRLAHAAFLAGLLLTASLGLGADAAAVATDSFPASPAVAVLDLPSQRLDEPDIAAEIERGLRAVRARGATLAVLPGPVGLNAGADPLGEIMPGPTAAWAGALARSLDMWIVSPVFERADDAATGGHPFVTMLLLDPGGKIAFKSRAVVANPAFDAMQVARSRYSETLRAVDAGGMRVGLLAGNEANGVLRLSDLGADIILMSANFLDAGGRDELIALARKANVNIAIANRASPGGARAFIATASGDLAGQDAGGGWLVGTISASARGAGGPAALGLPATVPHPKHAVASGSAAELGRKLFFDPRLSRDGQVACASCHRPSMAFSNGAPRGEGADGHKTGRNVTSLLNVAYRPLLRWDGYASSLENFVKYPIIGTREMNAGDLDRLVGLVQSDEEYRDAFARVFGAGEITFGGIELALAAYMRTLTSANSPFDRFYFGGHAGALTPQQKRGFALFLAKGCAQCHPIGERGALFSDDAHHDLGVGWRSGTASYDDAGLGGIDAARQAGRFLTPSLRDAARTAPYMHDGSLATLREVVEFFDRGGNPSPGRDPRIVPLGLAEQEKADLVAFLESLTGDAAWDDAGRPVGRE